MRERAARCFGAARKAINRLKHYYEVECLDPANHRNPAFPYQSNYVDVDDKNVKQFTYVRAVEGTKIIFECASNGSPLCVKYVRRYSKEAHCKSAEQEFAPRLRGFQDIGGGWYMVVMDWVGDEYQLLDESHMKERFFSQVRDKVALLHQTGYVHGDIRPSNIMVRKDGEPGIILLDFDWAGKIEEVRYPMNVNFADILRPTGARDGEFILADHDMEMVDLLSRNM
jgi:serine/threonine protein kinase